MSTVINIENIITRFRGRTIHDGVSLHIEKNEIYGILGKSGSGKSVLMREMIMLLEPSGGKIEVLGRNIGTIGFKEAQKLRGEWGVLFQFGALYSSLTVAENIEIQLKEYTHLNKYMREKLVRSKIALVGLDAHVATLYPSELSGGMVKRAALARALAMDPKLLFLDEPTSGLDPVGARNFDKLIVELRNMLGITVVMITHDLDSIFNIVDRMAILADKQVVAEGNMKKVLRSTHPFVEAFFKNEYTKEKFAQKLKEGEGNV
ncbi:MAG: ATP-binding cassette domain-containing protein [Sulfurovum sp.]|nr:ATP-binding cassette domain-containing protein [Sulfurovum sp.]MCB4744287.1 ATP-binding cassette domain-containing protein [Sulfurovum sp.]MCB4745839.1 ATP-binding cassette domain-containing protein [Sulfurovum sp.]MCB4747353.1 ATP-binding cassette domain-containing protein [Sulfurovum sp.]MCB4748663.1 ATP-binding cassette domain-containing protein [Sulfurovum sp.]